MQRVLKSIPDEPVNVQLSASAAQKLGEARPLKIRLRLASGSPVFGAGTETSDSIPARLSRGEHVWTAKEVKALGGHKNVMLLRQVVLDRKIPDPRDLPTKRADRRTFATGGAVEDDVHIRPKVGGSVRTGGVSAYIKGVAASIGRTLSAQFSAGVVKQLAAELATGGGEPLGRSGGNDVTGAARAGGSGSLGRSTANHMCGLGSVRAVMTARGSSRRSSTRRSGGTRTGVSGPRAPCRGTGSVVSGVTRSATSRGPLGTCRGTSMVSGWSPPTGRCGWVALRGRR